MPLLILSDLDFIQLPAPSGNKKVNSAELARQTATGTRCCGRKSPRNMTFASNREGLQKPTLKTWGASSYRFSRNSVQRIVLSCYEKGH